jgi:hypothetical protein
MNKDSATFSAVSFERTTEALDETDPAAGKEMKVSAVGKGGVLNIQPSFDIANRTNSPIERQRYTVISFDMIQSILPDFVFEDGNKDLYDYSTKYQPLIHFNNLNYALRNSYIPGTGYRQKKLDSTYLPVYKNVNHAETSNKTKIEYFYNKTNLSMFFRGNGLNGRNVSTFVLDNLKLYEVDMIPFFQYFTEENINRSISVPYQAIAPEVDYSENDYSLLDNSIYGLDSFFIYQPTTETIIEPEYVEDVIVEEVVAEATIAGTLLDFTLTTSCPQSSDLVTINATDPKGGTPPYRFSRNAFEVEGDALAATAVDTEMVPANSTYAVVPNKEYFISIKDATGKTAVKTKYVLPCNPVMLTRTSAFISQNSQVTADSACNPSLSTKIVYIQMTNPFLGVSKGDVLFYNETGQLKFTPQAAAGGITPHPWYRFSLNKSLVGVNTSCTTMAIKVKNDGTGVIEDIICCASSGGETGEGGF